MKGSKASNRFSRKLPSARKKPVTQQSESRSPNGLGLQIIQVHNADFSQSELYKFARHLIFFSTRGPLSVSLT